MDGRLKIVDGQSHAVLAACDVTLIASGTATLEAALFKRPMVIAYNMNWLTYQLMKRKHLQPWIGLPNMLVPRFRRARTGAARGDARAAGRGHAALAGRARSAWRPCEQTFTALHDELRRDTPRLAADAIAQVLAG